MQVRLFVRPIWLRFSGSRRCSRDASSITTDRPTPPLQRPRHWRHLRNEAVDSWGRALSGKYRNRPSLTALQESLPVGRNRGSDT
jgi:hypothetical protein